MKNKFVAVMIIFFICALAPWIWLSQEFGLANIPHYPLTMWIFMELYALIAGIIGLGITLIALSNGEDEPKKKKRKKSNGKKKPRKAHVKSSEKKKWAETKKVKTIKVRKLPEPKPDEIFYPAEWDEREFD